MAKGPWIHQSFAMGLGKGCCHSQDFATTFVIVFATVFATAFGIAFAIAFAIVFAIVFATPFAAGSGITFAISFAIAFANLSKKRGLNAPGPPSPHSSHKKIVEKNILV